MFGIDNKQLVIGGNVWVFKLDPNATSLNELVPPKAYIYKGRYSNLQEEYILLNDSDTNDEFRIAVDMDYANMSTGYFIVAQNRKRILEVIGNVAKKPLMDMTFKFLATEYIKYVKSEKPEWVI